VSVVANVAINVDSRGAVSNLRSVQNQAQSTEKAFSGVTAAASKLAIAFGGIQAAKFIFVKTAELESQTRSLQVLAGSAEKAGKIIKDLQKLGAVTPFTSTELIDSAKRLQAFGVQTEKVVEVTRRLADASGATGAELSGLVTAYGQVQAKGRLQGEELLQFQERGIGLQQELGKMYGLTGEELQKALSKGRISAEAVEVAFIRLTESGGKYAGGAIAQSDTLAGLMSTLQDSVDELARQFGGALSQSVKDATKLLIGFVSGIASIPQPVIQAAAELAKFIAQMVLVQKIIQIIIGLRAAYVAAMIGMAGATATAGAAATTSAGAFALYTNNARAMQAASIAATGSVSGLAGALLGLAGIGIITVGVNYVVTQVGAISGNISLINASEAAGTSGGLAAQLKGKSAAERKKMMAAAQKNLANDQKLAQRLQLQMKAQEAASTDKPDPSQRTELLAAQARIKTNQARIRAIQSTPVTAGAAPTKPSVVPDLLAETGGVGGKKRKGKSDAERAAEKAAKEAERAAEAAKQEAERVQEVIRNRLAEGQIIAVKIQQQDRIAAAEAAGDKMLVARLKSAEQELDIQYRYAQELAKESNLDAQKAIVYEGLNALTANQLNLQRELDALQAQSDQDRLTSLQKYIEKQYELNKSVQNQLRLSDGVANTLGEGLGSAFSALISGAQGWEQSLQQIASGVLIDIANQLIRIFVIEQAINAIKTLLTPFSAATPLGAGGGMVGKFGTLGPNYGIPQRAKGGPVSSGQTYMVGERGPELFVPGRSGTIVANDKMGGGNTNVVVNVDAKGSSVEGDEQGANQLGRVISAAVQSELIKQQRPGGILAR
jgi:tape measure domain-containing protein